MKSAGSVWGGPPVLLQLQRGVVRVALDGGSSGSSVFSLWMGGQGYGGVCVHMHSVLKW